MVAVDEACLHRRCDFPFSFESGAKSTCFSLMLRNAHLMWRLSFATRIRRGLPNSPSE